MYGKYLICSAVARRRKVGGGHKLFSGNSKKKKKKKKKKGHSGVKAKDMVDMVLWVNVKGAYKTTTYYVNLYFNCIERGSSHRVFLTHIQKRAILGICRHVDWHIPVLPQRESRWHLCNMHNLIVIIFENYYYVHVGRQCIYWYM